MRDFPSAKALANRINYLHNNDAEYLTYHWWREHYAVTFGGHHKNRNAWCDLCKRLNNKDEPVGDIGDYFGEAMKHCHEPNWKLK